MLTRHHRGEEPQEEKRGTLFVIRQIINILFMAGAIIGVVMYLNSPADDRNLSIMVIMCAMALKMFECVLRYLK